MGSKATARAQGVNSSTRFFFGAGFFAEPGVAAGFGAGFAMVLAGGGGSSSISICAGSEVAAAAGVASTGFVSAVMAAVVLAVASPAFSEVVIRSRFLDFTGKYVYHCHILDHEDMGMMGVVEVVAPA